MLIPSLEQLQGEDLAALESALADICERENTVEPLLLSLSKASPAVAVSLVNVLGAVGTPQALSGLRSALDSHAGDVQLAAVRALSRWHDEAPLDVLRRLAEEDPSEEIRALAQEGVVRLQPKPATPSGPHGKTDPSLNLALGATATSPDGLEKDGEAGGDEAAIDGDPATYWDKQDHQKLYHLRVQLRTVSPVAYLRILGWQHHNYAPKDFEVLLDGQTAFSITNAHYSNNWFTLAFPAVSCQTVELKITGSHGPSPAIRELEIYSTIPND
jgi:hypothetical protein